MSLETTDPEYNITKIREVVGVSNRIQELAKRLKMSPPPISKEEEMRRKLVNIDIPQFYNNP